MTDRQRPSLHGQILGQALADIAKAGGIGTTCADCAFREDCMTNTMAATLSDALTCLATDGEFGCHHGLVNGVPTKMCAGMAAARRAPSSVIFSALQTAHARLANLPAEDPIRASFDVWMAEHDPEGRMNDYQISRYWKPPQKESEKP
jgi:hypothetical protein